MRLNGWISRMVLLVWSGFVLSAAGQDPCASTGPGLPYVSTNPNYVCESLETFVYINVAQGYANPSDAAAENFNFSWYPEDVLGTIETQSFEMSFDSSLTLWCLALDLQNNCLWTDTITVQVAEAVEIGLPADTLVCDLNGFTLQPAATAQAMPGVTWNWEPSLLLLNANTPTPELLIDADQWYHVTATTPAPGNCAYEDSIFVTANVAPIELGPDQEWCEGETSLLDTGLDPAIEAISWSTGDTVSFIVVDTTGVYWVTALNPQGCTRTDTVRIDIYNDPVLTLEAGSAACLGQPVELVATVDSDTTVAGVGWSSGEAGMSISVTEPGVYEAIAVDVTGCSGTASISPEFLPSPVPELQPDTTICLEDEGPIWIDVSQPGVSYLWSTGESQPGALLSEPGTYSVTLTLLANGCQDSASIELIDFCLQDSVYFPTAFTPDGDLVNDRFGGVAEGIGSFELTVYNRWGIEVFRSEALEERWNGRLQNGELAPGGLYAWRAVWRPLAADGVSFRAYQEKVGSVTLIR